MFDASIRAKKFVFFAISTRAAKKTLPDGRNAHLTVQSPDWWQGFVTSVAFEGPEIVLNFDPGG